MDYSTPLVHFSAEAFGVASSHHTSTGLSFPSHAVSQGSGRKPSSSSKSLSSHSPWASIFASDICWIPRTHFSPASQSHIAKFQCLDTNIPETVSHRVFHHSAVFPEVLYICFLNFIHKQNCEIIHTCPDWQK